MRSILFKKAPFRSPYPNIPRFKERCSWHRGRPPIQHRQGLHQATPDRGRRKRGEAAGNDRKRRWRCLWPLVASIVAEKHGRRSTNLFHQSGAVACRGLVRGSCGARAKFLDGAAVKLIPKTHQSESDHFHRERPRSILSPSCACTELSTQLGCYLLYSIGEVRIDPAGLLCRWCGVVLSLDLVRGAAVSERCLGRPHLAT